MRVVCRLVFLHHRFCHLFPVEAPVFDDGEVGLATILEDAGLYVVIAFLGIVVQVGEAPLRHVVDVDVLSQRRTVLLQRVTDTGGQRQTDVAVGSGLLVQHVLWHGLKTGYQRVVAGYLDVGLVHKGLERQLLFVELLIQLRGLVAGVSQVEYVFLLLRVEHQRVLVRALHGRNQLLAHHLALFLIHLESFRQLMVVVGQLRT